MEPRVDPLVAELRDRLERELDRQLAPPYGCWPLLVGLVGVLLGLLLLLDQL
ncbi:MAG: hypothetical protein HXY19_01640 [Thermoanaerobaculaceae bacterium]|nr:hypothetical protein [Thermoanaerobaculaceae bacterium]